MTYIRYSALPAVHQELAETMIYASPGAGVPSQFLPGTIDLHWIREAEYQVKLEHKGVLVLELSQWADTGALGDALENALDAARRATSNFRIDDASSLSCHVTVSLYDRPYFPASTDDPSKRVRHWLAPSTQIYHRNADLGAAWLALSPSERADNPLPRVEALQLLADFEVWNNSLSRDEIDRRASSMLIAAAEAFQGPRLSPEIEVISEAVGTG